MYVETAMKNCTSAFTTIAARLRKTRIATRNSLTRIFRFRLEPSPFDRVVTTYVYTFEELALSNRYKI